MKRSIVTATLLAAVAAPLHSQGRVTEALGWLAGCWVQRTATGTVEEHWSTAAGGILLGFSKTVRRDSLREYEFIRIDASGDTLVYHAQPVRQAPAEFRAVPPFDSGFVFANPAHDFPQRIIYRRIGTDTLHARVEGMRNGEIRGFDLRYARTPCQ